MYIPVAGVAEKQTLVGTKVIRPHLILFLVCRIAISTLTVISKAMFVPYYKNIIIILMGVKSIKSPLFANLVNYFDGVNFRYITAHCIWHPLHTLVNWELINVRNPTQLINLLWHNIIYYSLVLFYVSTAVRTDYVTLDFPASNCWQAIISNITVIGQRKQF